MRHRFFSVTIALLTALGTPALGAPPMWTVTDEDSTIVLFPTIHILPEGLDWQSNKLTAVMREADEVWFELHPDEVNDDALMQRLAIKHGVTPDRPLSRRLDDEMYKEFCRAAEELGLRPQDIDMFRPWLAAVTLAVTDLVRDGFDPEAGVEMVLAEMVPARKHRGLETADEQLGFFGGLSEEIEIAFLQQAMTEVGQGAAELRSLALAWAQGDISALEDLMLASVRDVSEELYQILLVKRNATWAERLELEMAGTGVDVVAVGGGHLVGDDSLPAMMKKRGYQVDGPGF